MELKVWYNQQKREIPQTKISLLNTKQKNMNKVLIGIKTEEKIIGITTIEEKRISMTEGVGKKTSMKA